MSVRARLDEGWGVPGMPAPEDRWRKFWAVSDAVQWPSQRAVSDDDVQAIAVGYAWLPHPEVPIFHCAVRVDRIGGVATPASTGIGGVATFTLCNR